MSDQNKVRKRVVLKVWQRDGVVVDNAHEIEWLERNGWNVICAEKLRDDSATGTCEVLYLLEWPDGIAPPAPPPTDGPVTIVTPTINIPGFNVRVVLTCSTTRGRVLISQVQPATTALDTVIGPPAGTQFPTTSVGVLVLPERSAGDFGPRVLEVLCVNDAAPYPGPLPAPPYPEGPHAVVRLDAVFVGDSVTVALTGQPPPLDNKLIPAGETRVYYIPFVNTP